MKRTVASTIACLPALFIFAVGIIIGVDARRLEVKENSLQQKLTPSPTWHFGSPVEDVYRIEGTPVSIGASQIAYITSGGMRYSTVLEYERGHGFLAYDQIDSIEIVDDKVAGFNNNSGMLHVSMLLPGTKNTYINYDTTR